MSVDLAEDKKKLKLTIQKKTKKNIKRKIHNKTPNFVVVLLWSEIT